MGDPMRSMMQPALTAEEAGGQPASDLVAGLTSQQAKKRLEETGPNILAAEKSPSFWQEFFAELREPMVLMLLVTGVLYAVWGEFSDAVTIFIIILALNTIEVVNEQRSKKAIASLHKLAEPTATVQRDGHFLILPVENIVPGDLVMLQEGHRVPADARLVTAYGLSVDESTLTGESLPVEKHAGAGETPQTPLAERSGMVYSSTLVTRGKGTAVVAATGMNSEIGRIAELARRQKEPRTPLQQGMDELSKTLVWFALGFSVLVPLVGIFAAHLPPRQMLLTGLSLAFATIPEEMPILITMVLSLGAFRLSKKHAIAKRLNAVESLGSVTVIATDKTGTLTENRMEAARIEPEEQRQRILTIGVLCNDAVSGGQNPFGDPVDTALLRAAEKGGMDPDSIRRAAPMREEFTFDNTRKRMSVIVQPGDQWWAAVKGAPESILAVSTRRRVGESTAALDEGGRQAILNQAAVMAENGLRVLAIAERRLPDQIHSMNAVERDLTFVGLVGLADPPRPETAGAIAAARQAGIRILMITGDHPLTARSIARLVGLERGLTVVTGPELDALDDAGLEETVKHTSIFARATPEHKLRIVQALQRQGERVAVTGDGVNDAPALAAADIGVAMGETGTDVAREASDLVLADNNFTTILNAVEEGRLIYENLKKGVRYYLTCKLALVLISLIPTLLLIPVPFAPVQIILMELFMDLMAAASFVAEAAESDLLNQKPRDPKARFMDKAMAGSIVTSSLGLVAAVTFIYLGSWFTTHDLAASQTAAFFSWMVGHLLLAFNMRSERQPIFQLGLTRNRMMVLWAAAVAVFLAAVSLIPEAGAVFHITSLSGARWGEILAASVLGTFWMEARKLATFRQGGSI